jgi:homoserine O-succinyltransferase/O-acetyltransferase
VYVAHSRWNEISAGDLARCGYRILTSAPAAGVDLFVREKRNTWLFFQGHPEYDPGALGREYQRDVRRYLARERDTYPELPKNYFGTAECALLAEFAERARAARDERLMRKFPYSACPHGIARGWQSPTAGVIGVWLKQIAEAKLDRPKYARADWIEPRAVSLP